MKNRCIVLLLGLFVLSLTGCGEYGVTMIKEDSAEEVLIPILLQSDNESGEEYKDLIENFNRKYSGKYRVVVNYVTESEAGYRERLKILNAYDELPLIIKDAAFNAGFQDLMIQNGRLLDVRPYLEERGEWTSWLETADKQIYTVPVSGDIYSSAGLFYNKKLFRQAGIEKFPVTWEDFFDCLKQLKKKGITPLALHGSGEYWAAMLISTAYLCSSYDGKKFFETYFPESYNNQKMREMLEFFDSIYDYTFEDSLEIDFGQAQERFLKGDAAILANGYWMISDIENSGNTDIGFACFPENMLMVEEQMSGWSLVSGYSEKEIRGAVEFLAYRQKNSEISTENQSKLGRAYLNVFETTENFLGNYQMRWEEQIRHEVFDLVLPDFIRNHGNASEVIRQMDAVLKGS